MIRFFISGTFLIGLIFLLNTRFGTIPALGTFLDPQDGFWANAEWGDMENLDLELNGTIDEVRIFYDERRVPHIFAQNDHDLYFAQGFITAKDRLFQMEIQTYDAAGRLSEIVGESTLNRDLQMRRLGMKYAAELALEKVEKDSLIMSVFRAYSDGVNAYINSLSADEYPLEYKILGAKPEKWTPIKTAYLLKNMTYMLAGRSNDVRSSNTQAYFGAEYLEKFFNQKPALNDPVIPPSRKWDFEADIPEKPSEKFIPSITKNISPYQPHPNNGSNNWAVSGAKTKSGYPILANDPHLNMSLPAIWYEIQLHTPLSNTYGVSIPGAPAIIIGFNEHIAWGVTNVGSDVMDWYEIKFKDDSLNEYWHDGEWKKTSKHIEEIKIRGGQTIVDTLVFTHHGPVQQVNSDEPEAEPIYHALRWIAHEPSNELRTFYKLNRAQNYSDYEHALKDYSAPAQNFVFADKHGDIALWVNGKLPKKWNYQGRTVSDGTSSKYDWQGWIPHEQNPWIKNPARGFVSSANQESAAPDYPYYLNDDFGPFERGRRINEMLADMNDITPEDMQQLQLDNYSYFAATALPLMLQYLDADTLDETNEMALTDLKSWNYFNEAEKIAPSVFKIWWNYLVSGIFSDEFSAANVPLRYPARDRLIEVLKEEPGLKYLDDITTPEIENLSDIINASFFKAVERMKNLYGEFGEKWKWKYYNNTNLHHLAQIPGLGEYNIETDGGYESVNAISGSHGPSWRMVVELGPEVKAWGVYPGGASGNPGSTNYNAYIEVWRNGELFELNFLRDEPIDYYPKITLK